MTTIRRYIVPSQRSLAFRARRRRAQSVILGRKGGTGRTSSVDDGAYGTSVLSRGPLATWYRRPGHAPAEFCVEVLLERDRVIVRGVMRAIDDRDGTALRNRHDGP